MTVLLFTCMLYLLLMRNKWIKPQNFDVYFTFDGKVKCTMPQGWGVGGCLSPSRLPWARRWTNH